MDPPAARSPFALRASRAFVYTAGVATAALAVTLATTWRLFDHAIGYTAWITRPPLRCGPGMLGWECLPRACPPPASSDRVVVAAALLAAASLLAAIASLARTRRPARAPAPLASSAYRGPSPPAAPPAARARGALADARRDAARAASRAAWSTALACCVALLAIGHVIPWAFHGCRVHPRELYAGLALAALLALTPVTLAVLAGLRGACRRIRSAAASRRR